MVLTECNFDGDAMNKSNETGSISKSISNINGTASTSTNVSRKDNMSDTFINNC
jgi:hypothetical protein